MEITINSEYEDLQKEHSKIKDQLTIILEERDDLVFHKALAIKTEYILKIGRYEFELFELECEILRLKRKIEMIQVCINIQVPVDIQQIDEQLEKEYIEYTKRLEKMASDLEMADCLDKCEKLTIEELAELKKLYRTLAKKLHPDVNANQTDDDKMLWNRVLSSYEDANIEMLRVLNELASEKALDSSIEGDISALEKLKDRITYLRDKIKDIIIDIENVKKTFPFNTVELLGDEELIQNRQNELHTQIEEGKKILETYKDHLLMIIPSSTKILH